MPKLEREGVALSPALASSGSGGIPQFPIGIYYDDGHAWVRLDEGNKARIGLDDFTQQVMGDIDEIEIPPVGSRLNRGEVAWRLRHGGRKLSQLAPLGGTVVEVNQRLSRDPSLANRSPYEEGWILKIHPKALTKEMPELMDSFQFRKHFDQTKAELRSFFNNEGLGRIYGDGEEVIRGAAEKLDERWWRVLVTQLFHSSPD
ncbi:MAG: glycine cleavage system protein H [Syntrophaceae bacterium]|nr:glycine cleavage system protein H [Syntrophaceae bacterium]